MGKVCAIIVAAGKGKRIGAGIKKQFLEIKNKPILFYTLDKFEKCKSIDSIILVTAKEDIDYCKEQIVYKYDLKKVELIVEGGIERQESVLNGLKSADGSEIVLIHDGARPFVEEEIIEEGIRFAKVYGACACGVLPKDTIKVKNAENFSETTLQRSNLFSVQTPQCFKYDMILECHNKAHKEGILVTDDTMVVERYGNRVFLYSGSYSNIKITTPEDLVIAEVILDRN